MTNQTALIQQKQDISLTIIRPELNLEKWPGIFTPTQSRAKAKTRTFEREKILENGNTILCKVTIKPSADFGSLTTEDQKVWYGLLELWERAGRPEILFFSLRELADVLGKSWGKDIREGLKKSLFRLNEVSFHWINSYFDSTSKKTLEFLNAFHIISDLQVVQLSNNHTINKEQCSCRFGHLLYQNLLNNYTKPTFLNIVLGFKSGVAQLLYKYLELVMHNKTSYERNSKDLLPDLGLEGEEYKYPFSRKRLLEIAIKELNAILKDLDNKDKGFPIQSGILFLKLQKTKDDSDWKVVVTKSPQMSFYEGREKVASEQLTTLLSNESKPTPHPPLSLAEEIIVFFLQKFHIKRKTPLKKELLTAKQWIDKYNLDIEKAQVFISRCKVWAAETDFDVQNFAGLQQYLDRTTEIFQQMEINRAIKICTLCNDNGYVEGKEQNGREFSLKCMHDVNHLQTYANKHKVQVMLKDRSIIQGE